MNNKGFTLMELLMVIAIIGILGVLVTVNLSKTLTDASQKNCNEFVKRVEEAACVYASLSQNRNNFKPMNCCGENKCCAKEDEKCEEKECKVQLSQLVESGNLKESKDACTNDSLKLDEYVYVYWKQNGLKTCTYDGVREYEG